MKGFRDCALRPEMENICELEEHEISLHHLTQESLNSRVISNRHLTVSTNQWLLGFRFVISQLAFPYSIIKVLRQTFQVMLRKGMCFEKKKEHQWRGNFVFFILFSWGKNTNKTMGEKKIFHKNFFGSSHPPMFSFLSIYGGNIW